MYGFVQQSWWQWTGLLAHGGILAIQGVPIDTITAAGGTDGVAQETAGDDVRYYSANIQTYRVHHAQPTECGNYLPLAGCHVNRKLTTVFRTT
jgi:hypothetical protein